MKVILDTNFMMIPHQFGVDIYEFLKYYRVATLSSCIHELKKLSEKKSEEGKAARIALELAERSKIEIIKTEKKGDSAIIDYAIENKCAVATNDKEMIKTLKSKNIRIIRLRQKKYLVEE